VDLNDLPIPDYVGVQDEENKVRITGEPYDPLEMPLRMLDVEKDIMNDFTVVLVGRRRSGKSWMCRWLMYHLRNRFPVVVVITGTKLNSFWSQYVPDELIFSIDDMDDVITRIKERQRILLEHPSLDINPAIMLILDDVLQEKYKVTHSKCLSACFTDGRHYKISLFITTQDPRGIPPMLRENSDLAILFRIFQRGRKEAVAEDFLDYVDDKQTRMDFLWKNTSRVDETGTIIDEGAEFKGDKEEEYLDDEMVGIPQALCVLQARVSDNLQVIFKKAIAEDPGPFLLGDTKYIRATVTGEWNAVRGTWSEQKKRPPKIEPVYEAPK